MAFGVVLPAELDDLPEDEGVLGERPEHQQDAGEQPDLEGGHLTGDGDPHTERGENPFSSTGCPICL